MASYDAVTICDVGPRDGLQNQPVTLAPAVRAELVDMLAAAGVPRIEAVSFVSPKAVPQMAGAEEVVAAIERRDGVVYAGLALNERGYDRLRESGLDEVHVAFAATEEFNQRNAARVRGGERSQPPSGSSSAQPRTASARPSRSASRSAAPSRAPSTRVAWRSSPRGSRAGQTRSASRTRSASACRARCATSSAASRRSASRSAIHLHNTRNTGYANAFAALEAGATVFDASVGGIGGCPFAPRATGNIATEDLVYLFHGEGVETGIDLDALIDVAQWLEAQLGRELEGQVYKAGTFAPVAG